jgi:hypothetical protein
MTSRTTNEVTLRCTEPNGHRSVVLEDDGRVAYAYLFHGDAIVGDVWLYNVGTDPENVNWRDRSAMPFCNPAKYCSDEVLPRLRQDSKIECAWSDEGVTILVAELPWARLENGSKPGWSRKARLPGPLAKPLEPA